MAHLEHRPKVLGPDLQHRFVHVDGPAIHYELQIRESGVIEMFGHCLPQFFLQSESEE